MKLKKKKTDIAINFKFVNVFEKMYNKAGSPKNGGLNLMALAMPEKDKPPPLFENLDGLFKIYTEFNNNDVDFID